MADFVKKMYETKRDGLFNFYRAGDELSLPSNLQPIDINKTTKRLASVVIKSARTLITKKQDLLKQKQDATAKLRLAKQELDTIEEKINGLKDTDKLIPSIQKQLEKIMNELPILHIELIGSATTVFTTQLLKKKNRVYGVYQIFIDWTYEDWSYGIRIKNLYLRAGACDHPCVNGQSICSGNAGILFSNSFKNRDIYNLVYTLIEFLMADDVSHGYISSWTSWDQQARRVNLSREFNQFVNQPRSDSFIENADRESIQNLIRSILPSSEIPW